MAPFAYTYVKGPHPVTYRRTNSVGPVGVEVALAFAYFPFLPSTAAGYGNVV
jgi:hypothetical protein